MWCKCVWELKKEWDQTKPISPAQANDYKKNFKGHCGSFRQSKITCRDGRSENNWEKPCKENWNTTNMICDREIQLVYVRIGILS